MNNNSDLKELLQLERSAAINTWAGKCFGFALDGLERLEATNIALHARVKELEAMQIVYKDLACAAEYIRANVAAKGIEETIGAALDSIGKEKARIKRSMEATCP